MLKAAKSMLKAALRAAFQVAAAMGIPLWTLRLMQGSTILKEGKLSITEEPFLAVQVKCVEVQSRSGELAKAFKRPFRRQMNSLGQFQTNLETIESHLEAISNGEVDFTFKGENLLELCIANFPRWNVQDFVPRTSFLSSFQALFIGLRRCSVVKRGEKPPRPLSY